MILDITFVWYFGGAVVIYLCNYFLKHKIWTPLEEGQQSILGVATGFMATIFAFILGFTVADLWSEYKDADDLTVREATELRIVYRLTKGLDQSQKVRERVKQYTTAVIEDEWKTMTAGNSSPKADVAKNMLWDDALELIKNHPQEKVFTEAMLRSLIGFDHCRRERICSLKNSVHPLIFYTLVLSGFSTIVCFGFLFIRQTRLQHVLDAMVVSGVVFNIYLVIAIDHPYSGTGVTITPDAFQYLQQQLQTEMPEVGNGAVHSSK